MMYVGYGTHLYVAGTASFVCLVMSLTILTLYVEVVNWPKLMGVI